MSTVFGDIGRGYGRSAVVYLIATAIVLPLACVFICLPLWAVTNFDLSIWAMIIPAALFLLVLFGGSGIYMYIVLSRRKKMLDSVFGPLGLAGKAYHSFFRQYHGNYGGRKLDVYLSRGPRLEIEVSTSLQTRLGVSGPHPDTRFFAGLANKPPMSLSDPELSDLMVFPRDEGWARRLLDAPGAAEILKRLTTPPADFTRQQVVLRPGTFQLLLTGSTRMLAFELDPHETKQWMDDLLRLAKIAEDVPGVPEPDELSSLELSAYHLRERNPYLAVWVGLGMLVFFLLLTLCVAGGVALMVALE